MPAEGRPSQPTMPVWVDLSTFDVPEAKRFYKSVFKWSFSEDDGYHFAHRWGRLSAGVFQMPQFLVDMGMPSFWMSYFAVPSVDDAVASARNHDGAIVEMDPFDFGDGRVALVRDPAGAGFTLYEGPDIDARGDGSRNGQFVWNDLITSDIGLIEAFYGEVLDVTFTADAAAPGERFEIRNTSGRHIATCEVIPEDMRGGKVYWLPYFAVGSIDRISQKVLRHGGAEVYRTTDGRGEVAMFADSQGAVFAVLAT